MSRLTHCYSVEYAQLYGESCGTMIHHMQFWIEQNRSLKRNFHEGHTWMYQTQKEIAACYPYWSEDKVFRILKKLEKAGVLIKANFNRTKFDRTIWYAFKNEELFLAPRNRGMDKIDPKNPFRGVAEPIPDTKTDTKEIQQQGPLLSAIQKMKHNLHYPSPAAVSLKSSPEKTKNSIPPIHEPLEKVPIPKYDKIEITKMYDEKTVLHALQWAFHPDTIIKKDLAPAIKWACKIRPEIPKDKKLGEQKIPDYVSANRTIWRCIYDSIKNLPSRLEFREIGECIEIPNDKLYFRDVAFIEQVENFFRKQDVMTTKLDTYMKQMKVEFLNLCK